MQARPERTNTGASRVAGAVEEWALGQAVVDARRTGCCSSAGRSISWSPRGLYGERWWDQHLQV